MMMIKVTRREEEGGSMERRTHDDGTDEHSPIIERRIYVHKALMSGDSLEASSAHESRSCWTLRRAGDC